MGKNTFKRRQLLVDKQFQIKFIINILLVVIVIIALLSILLVYSTSAEMGNSVYSKLLELKNTREVILPTVLKISILILIVGGIFILIRFLILSHRIVGPLLRFKRVVKSLGDGDLTVNIYFRKYDELQDLAIIFTDSVKKLNKKLKMLKKDIDKINKIVNKKDKLTKNEVIELKKFISSLNENFSSFKL